MSNFNKVKSYKKLIKLMSPLEDRPKFTVGWLLILVPLIIILSFFVLNKLLVCSLGSIEIILFILILVRL